MISFLSFSLSLCLFFPSKFIGASLSPLPIWSIEVFHLLCNLILLGPTAHQTSALDWCHILLYSLVLLPAVAHYWWACTKTLQNFDLLCYSLSCYHQGLSRPYLSCPHPANHSTFRSIISLPPYFTEKTGAIQPTEWNIKFLWIQMWTLTYFFVFILSVTHSSSCSW